MLQTPSAASGESLLASVLFIWFVSIRMLNPPLLHVPAGTNDQLCCGLSFWSYCCMKFPFARETPVSSSALLLNWFLSVNVPPDSGIRNQLCC